MKFNNLVALIATISFAAQVNAQDGTLRRLAQNDQVTTVTTEVNTSVPVQQVQQQPSAVQQPATVVEAAPVAESKAEALRKARQGAEISTEQKIVEKLEESRLKEEQDRADRLFGTKLDATAQKQLEEASKAQAQKVEPTPVVVPVAPVAPQPTQVTIEKVEIIQPAQSTVAAPEIKEVKEAPAVSKSASVAASQSDVEASDEEAPTPKWYVDASLGAVSYNASNVKANFGGGAAVGMLFNERTSAELGFLYSNHYIDTFWDPQLFREMDQYDISLTGKYNILTGKLRPYVGGGAAYVIRNYQQRIINPNGGLSIAGPSETSTDSVNFILLAGVDFQLTDAISIGAGMDYSKNVMNRNEFNFSQYALPEGTKAIEEIDFFTTKVTAKMSF